MPQSTATITAEQREALYELVVDHLSGIADLPLALEHENFVIAHQLARRFAEDFRLLEDLGWSRGDERELFELTASPEVLAKTLGRLREDAGVGAAEPAEVRESRKLDQRGYRLALETCELLLAELGAGEEGSR